MNQDPHPAPAACAVPGCTDRRNIDQPLCPAHWDRVPRGLRLALWDERPGTLEHQWALEAVIAAATRGIA